MQQEGKMEKEESSDLEQLLSFQGDDFLNEDETKEKLARERRLARKRRLLAVEESNDTHETKKPHVENGEGRIVQENLLVSSERSKENEENAESSNDHDGFDMFSSLVSPVSTSATTTTLKTTSRTGVKRPGSGIFDQQQDWDDAEGYYKATIGETINLELPKTSSDIQFRISGVIGKGVFSTVWKCETESSNTSTPLPPQVAIKCIRHNETMAKAALNEIRFLQRFTSSPGIIPLLLPTDSVPLEHRGHTVLVFPYMEYNLRDVLTKFGKGVGLSLTAVRSYFGQLLAAATHLKQHKIVHSDLKPDNILVSQDFSQISICDFGSAVDGGDSGDMITPYLVSRFYRAPEIILGLSPTYAIDLWSLAVTVAELFLGKVLFHGINNNEMLQEIMQHMGPISNRLIRQHLVQSKRFPIPAHFTHEVSWSFLRAKINIQIRHEESAEDGLAANGSLLFCHSVFCFSTLWLDMMRPIQTCSSSSLFFHLLSLRSLGPLSFSRII
jgi:serine/threonine-protein kinase PRP4